MDRREFIRNTLATAAALAAARASVLAHVSQTPKKIIIVGGGLSGLVAGYELKKLGHNITILEAQSRAGGRVLTLRGFSDGLWADAGAARIPQDHDLTHRYVKEFALELMPFYPTTNKFLRASNGAPQQVDWNDFARATSSVMGIETPDHWQKIKGGNDLLPAAFAERLKANIRLDSPVASVERTDKDVTVKFTEKGKLTSISGDHAILAIPMTLLRDVTFTPALPDKKITAISRTQYDSASRMFLQTKDRFWLQKGLNGFAFGRKNEEIWDSTFGQPGTRGILQTYSRYSTSLTFTGQTPDQRIATTITDLEFFHPDLKTHFEKGFTKCWTEDPWAKGAWSHMQGNDSLAMLQSEPRLSFAGEHLSSAQSWMQGALQSGLRVVGEITGTNAARPATVR